jgi:hypothetical protein
MGVLFHLPLETHASRGLDGFFAVAGSVIPEVNTLAIAIGEVSEPGYNAQIG